MNILYVLTRQQGTKTTVWAMVDNLNSTDYISSPGGGYLPMPNCILVWGALDGKLSSRRIHSYTSHHKKLYRDKVQSQKYVVADPDSEAMKKVREHLDKHIAWEQLAGITADYASKKIQFD